MKYKAIRTLVDEMLSRGVTHPFRSSVKGATKKATFRGWGKGHISIICDSSKYENRCWASFKRGDKQYYELTLYQDGRDGWFYLFSGTKKQLVNDLASWRTQVEI